MKLIVGQVLDKANPSSRIVGDESASTLFIAFPDNDITDDVCLRPLSSSRVSAETCADTGSKSPPSFITMATAASSTMPRRASASRLAKSGSRRLARSGASETVTVLSSTGVYVVRPLRQREVRLIWLRRGISRGLRARIWSALRNGFIARVSKGRSLRRTGFATRARRRRRGKGARGERWDEVAWTIGLNATELLYFSSGPARFV